MFRRLLPNLSEDICFVTGPAPSGTTLLQGLLETNDNVLAECILITQQVIDYKRKQASNSYKVKAFIPDEETLRSTYRTYILTLVRNLKRRNVVVKDPHLSVHLQLLQIFREYNDLFYTQMTIDKISERRQGK